MLTMTGSASAAPSKHSSYTRTPLRFGVDTLTFQNIVSLSLVLARKDQDAFSSLFLPDAIKALRPRGKGAIEVTTPVLFLNELNVPQVFLRIETGEYKIGWRGDCPPLVRAAEFLKKHARPFSPGST